MEQWQQIDARDGVSVALDPRQHARVETVSLCGEHKARHRGAAAGCGAARALDEPRQVGVSTDEHDERAHQIARRASSSGGGGV